MAEYWVEVPLNAFKITDGIIKVPVDNPAFARVLAQLPTSENIVENALWKAIVSDQELAQLVTENPRPKFGFTLGDPIRIGNGHHVPFVVWAYRLNQPRTFDEVFWNLDQDARDFAWGIFDPGTCDCGRPYERNLAKIGRNKDGRLALCCGHPDCDRAKTL